MTPNNLCLSVHQNQRNFFDSKKSFELNYRIKSLKKLKATIIKFEKNIVDALKLDLGKSYAESYMSEISIIYNEINYVLKNLKKWSKRKKVSSSLLNFFSTDYIQPNPYGVTLNISPWNYPFQLSISPIIGAISAGNTVVLKPSEHSPHTTAILETIINEAFSRGHVDIITGGPKTGKNLLELNWDYIFFTGSTEIGKIVASQAAKTLTPLTLELGGNNPCIVDKDVSSAIASKRIAWGKFLNCGQTCIAPNFIAVHEDVKDNFIQSLTKEIITNAADAAGCKSKIQWGDLEINLDNFKQSTLSDLILDFNTDLSKDDLSNQKKLEKILKDKKVKIEKNWGIGRILLEVFEETVEDQLIDPTFVTEYPVEVSPLSRRNETNPDYADRFELFIGGKEFANGFCELNDPDDQASRFEDQVAAKDSGDKEAMDYDHDYITALEHGMPPAVGVGMGVDRLVMLLTNQSSIRDVLLFPQLKS